jgi:hypothetical protein
MAPPPAVLDQQPVSRNHRSLLVRQSPCPVSCPIKLASAFRLDRELHLPKAWAESGVARVGAPEGWAPIRVHRHFGGATEHYIEQTVRGLNLVLI